MKPDTPLHAPSPNSDSTTPLPPTRICRYRVGARRLAPCVNAAPPTGPPPFAWLLSSQHPLPRNHRGTIKSSRRLPHRFSSPTLAPLHFPSARVRLDLPWLFFTPRHRHLFSSPMRVATTFSFSPFLLFCLPLTSLPYSSTCRNPPQVTVGHHALPPQSNAAEPAILHCLTVDMTFR
jgi:hypothetical protein